MNLLGRAVEKEFWDEVRTSSRLEGYRNNLLSDWQKLVDEGSLLTLKYSEFKMFFESGERSTYQRSYEHHRFAATVSAMLALIYPEEEKYINYLMDAIYTLCDEYTWSYPAHQGEGWQKNNNTSIDLTASRVAMDLATMYVLFGDRLDPLIRSRIATEIERRTFEPFRRINPYYWETYTSNWVAVCMGAVAKAFMLMRPDEAKELMPRFIEGMERYLTSFADDGFCSEGGGYWMFGFGAFVGFAKSVRIFTNGEIDYFKNPKVKNISLFYQRIFLSGDITANFADSGEHGVIGALSRGLKPEFPDEIIVPAINKTKIFSSNEFSGKLGEASSLLKVYDEVEVGDDYYSDFYATDAEWYVKHTPLYGFAAKGGNNAELHNHNDVGSFIYAKGGRSILSDIGPAEYVRDYFGPKRYTFLETSSRGHSVPIIDGEYQKNGKEYTAKETKIENGIFSTEISHAYGLFEGDRIDRSFEFSERGFRLTDKFAFVEKRRVTERLITAIKPIAVESGMLSLDGTEIRYDDTKWRCEVSDGEIAGREKKPYYFIDFSPVGDLCDFVCTVDKFEQNDN